MHGPAQKRRRGATLVEVMIAAALVALLTITVLECVSVAARIARDNAELLAADSFAHDLLWCRFNMKYSDLAPGTETGTVSSEKGKPKIYSVPTGWNRGDWCRDQPLSWGVRVSQLGAGKLIEADVEWTSSSNETRRRHLEVYRSEMNRTR